MPVGEDVAKNAEHICAGIEAAARAKAEILLTPEGSLSGYRPDFDVTEVQAALARVTALAKRRSIGLALGTCHLEADGRCYNQIRFYRPNGDFLGFHSKTLLCGTLAAVSIGEIEHYASTELRVFTWVKGLTIGGLICNDLWANPQCTPMADAHLTQRLAEMGARIIFHAVNGGRSGGEASKLAWQYHEANLRMRAEAGALWVVTVDNAAPYKWPTSSPSGIVDPHGNWACRAKPKGLQLFVHTIDLARSSKNRAP